MYRCMFYMPFDYIRFNSYIFSCSIHILPDFGQLQMHFHLFLPCPAIPYGLLHFNKHLFHNLFYGFPLARNPITTELNGKMFAKIPTIPSTQISSIYKFRLKLKLSFSSVVVSLLLFLLFLFIHKCIVIYLVKVLNFFSIFFAYTRSDCFNTV